MPKKNQKGSFFERTDLFFLRKKEKNQKKEETKTFQVLVS